MVRWMVCEDTDQTMREHVVKMSIACETEHGMEE